ncbi:hypothetical protein, partial [Pseudomonas sp. AB12(2023)]|uniref:hypothetical protein n=1 Tax=Pseudomonas sp. AB12(2023) TaxID=3048597 RepID=UPI002B22D57A
ILENAAPAASTSGKETTETTNTPADLFPAPGICTSAGLCRPAAPGASPVWSNIGQAPLPSVLIELIELTSPVKHADTSPQ